MGTEPIEAANAAAVVEELLELRAALTDAETRLAPSLARVHPRHRASAVNLVHYVALRRHDVRDLQERLSRLGLSSLGRMEAHVLAGVDRVLGAACVIGGIDPPPPVLATVPLDTGRELLEANAQAIFGPPPPGRTTRILVTMPSTAADDPDLVAQMVDGGMDLARVNCAHDGPAEWARMIANIAAAGHAAGTTVPVAMDLAGPKLRTGPLEPGPMVVKVRPTRDAAGRVLAPAKVLLAVTPAAAVEGATTVRVGDTGWLARRRPGEVIRLVDARGSRRRLVVVAVDEAGCHAETARTTYFLTGATLRAGGPEAPDPVQVGPLPPASAALVLRPGDELVLTADLSPAPVPPAPPGPYRVRIGCTLPAAFGAVRRGHRVLLDDGKIGGVVTDVSPDEIVVAVTDAADTGTKLRAEKGINLPDTDLDIPALTGKDVEDLRFVAANAQIVALSFVREASDVEHLQEHLTELGAEGLGVVLKVETVAAFENLPELLLTAMRSDRVGVMIARGDLAVEAGYERLAEVQEEILWLCESAHVPVIWATQVLDTLARTGRPSRAEVSDAAMGERAECVMLNKGPYIVPAIVTLAGILERMTGHQSKKSSLLRELRSWGHHVS